MRKRNGRATAAASIALAFRTSGLMLALHFGLAQLCASPTTAQPAATKLAATKPAATKSTATQAVGAKAPGAPLAAVKMIPFNFPPESSLAVLDVSAPYTKPDGTPAIKFTKMQARGLIHIPSNASINIIFSYYGLEHLDAFVQLKAVNVTQMNASRLEMDDKQAEVLRNFPNFLRMNFDNTLITDKTLAIIHTFKNLDDLRISATDITGSGFDQLDGLPITNFNMGSLSLKPNMMSKFKSLPSTVTSLNCTRCQLGPAEISFVGKCHKLVALDIGGNKALNDVTIKEFSNLKLLDYINVADTSVTDKSLPFLAKLPSLHKITIRANHFWTVNKIKSPRPDLIVEDVTGSARAPVEVFDPLH
ncbi:MAG: hypothetical protein KGS72_23515 [Cyanobacteria bacterium REEB67]|nr:hypothetical protein [Cyanobacteria bacterium REEB67]